MGIDFRRSELARERCLPAGLAFIPKSALSLTLSLKGEGTVGQALVFRS